MSRYISVKSIIASRKSLFLLLLCQLFILTCACGSYLLNRGEAFSRTFSCDELALSAGVQENDVIRIDEGNGTQGIFLTVEQPLEKGVYLVMVNYAASAQGNSISASSTYLNGLELRSNPADLSPDMQSATLTVDIRRDTPQLTISVSYSGSGSLEITGLGIYETSNLYRRNLVYAFAACIILALIYYFAHSDLAGRKIMFALSIIFAISCYPLCVDYMLVGHDLPFHLLRIEGIYQGLAQGTFPVKIHPVWAQDYGYAVGVFYGDAALYFPALLRIMGFSIQSAYKCFAAACNLGTVLVSYFCFRKMFHSDKIGLWGCLLYTLSAYRLADVYTRAACGEYTALMVLPLVFCGFYLIFTEKNSTLCANWWKYSIMIALGLTGVIQSHILSCEMTAIFILLVCIIMIKKVFQRQIFLSLVSAAALTVFMNLGFLIPFLHYFDDSIYINSSEWGAHISYSIQNKGMFLSQLLGLLHKANGGTWQTEAGVNTEATYAIGYTLVLGIVLFMYLVCCFSKEEARAHKNFRPACLSFGLGILSLYMSTCYFPWDALSSLSSVTAKLIVSLEFPWRFLSICTILLVFSACYAISILPQVVPENICHPVSVGLIAILLVECGWYYYDFTFTGEPYRVFDTYELNSMAMYSYDYLPAGTDPNLIRYGTVYTGENLEIAAYQKIGTTIYCQLRTIGDSFIEFPLNYYKDYACRDTSTGIEYAVTPGTNNMVKVTIPAGYEGTIQVSFREPLLWRICELISLLSVLSAMTVLVYRSEAVQKFRKQFLQRSNAQADNPAAKPEDEISA